MVCKQNCYSKEQNLIMTSKPTLIRCWYELRIRYCNSTFYECPVVFKLWSVLNCLNKHCVCFWCSSKDKWNFPISPWWYLLVWMFKLQCFRRNNLVLIFDHQSFSVGCGVCLHQYLVPIFVDYLTWMSNFWLISYSPILWTVIFICQLPSWLIKLPDLE